MILDKAQVPLYVQLADRIQAQIDALIKQAGVRLRQQRRAMAVRRLAQAAHCRLASSDDSDPLPGF